MIVNAHWSNRGDEAALRAIIDSLRKRKPEWAIEVMFKDGKDITEFPYSDITYFSSKFLPLNTSELFRAVYAKGSKEIVKNAALAEAVQKCLSADMLVYSPGGSVICDRFWWIKQLEYLLPFACAKVYGIPLVVAAPSMGPFASWELEHWRNLVRHMLLSSAKTICLRECTSKQYLDEIFRVDDNNPAIVTIDSAFLDDAPVGDMLLEQDYE